MPHRHTIADEGPLVLTALQYFTRLPVSVPTPFSQQRLDQSIRYFPLVGIMVGGIMVAGFQAAAALWPPTIAVALAMVLGVLLTGGLHEDGLADFCDAFFAGRDREQTLAIMRDPRLGSYGVLGLILSFLVRYMALLALAPVTLLPALIAAQAFSRLLTLLAMRRLAYARSDAAGTKPAATALGRSGRLIAAACGLLPLIVLGWSALPAAFAAAGVGLILAGICRRRIGGYTGDCLGAIQQLSEIAFYLGLLA